MIIAYIIQSLLLLAAYLVQSMSRSWIRLASAPAFFVCRFHHRRGSMTAWEQAKRLQERWRFPRHAAALIAALVEFQKTQIFFVMTVNVAIIVALYNGAYVDATSWGELWRNIDLISVVTFYANHPIALGLLLLRKAGKLSWYIVTASCCCVLVISIAEIKLGASNLSQTQITQKTPGLDACFEEAPSQYCFPDAGVYNPDRYVTNPFIEVIWITPLIIAAMLVEKLGSVRIRAGQSIHHHVVQMTEHWLAGVPGYSIIERLIRFGKHCSSLFAEVWLVTIITAGISRYVQLLLRSDNGRWPLGQIIAVAVWVPVVVEYLYLSLCKSTRETKPSVSLHKLMRL